MMSLCMLTASNESLQRLLFSTSIAVELGQYEFEIKPALGWFDQAHIRRWKGENPMRSLQCQLAPLKRAS